MEKQSDKSKDITSVNEMFVYAKHTPVTEKIFVTDAVSTQLFTFLTRINKMIPEQDKIIIDPEFFLSDSLKFTDCEIYWRWKTRTKDAWSKFRVVLFPEYKNIISHAEDDNVIIGFIQMDKAIVPFGIAMDRSRFIYGNIYLASGLSVGFTNHRFNKNPHSLRNLFVCITFVWYAAQVAAVDPLMKFLFDRPVVRSDKSGNLINIYGLNAKKVGALLY